MRHGTNGFTSLPKEGVLRIFSHLKNTTASAGFEPANLGTKGQHATSRPPKPLIYKVSTGFILILDKYRVCRAVRLIETRKTVLAGEAKERDNLRDLD